MEIGGLPGNHFLAQGGPCHVIPEAGIVPRVRSDRDNRIPDLGINFAPPSSALIVSEVILLIEILTPSHEIG